MKGSNVLHDLIRGPLATMHRFYFLPKTLDTEKYFFNTVFGFQCEYLPLIFLGI